jgi:hypothetical protein
VLHCNKVWRAEIHPWASLVAHANIQDELSSTDLGAWMQSCWLYKPKSRPNTTKFCHLTVSQRRIGWIMELAAGDGMSNCLSLDRRIYRNYDRALTSYDQCRNDWISLGFRELSGKCNYFHTRSEHLFLIDMPLPFDEYIDRYPINDRSISYVNERYPFRRWVNKNADYDNVCRLVPRPLYPVLDLSVERYFAKIQRFDPIVENLEKRNIHFLGQLVVITFDEFSKLSGEGHEANMHFRDHLNRSGLDFQMRVPAWRPQYGQSLHR